MTTLRWVSVRWATVLGAALAFGGSDVQAQAFGPQFSLNHDADFGVGIRVEFDVPNLFTNEGPFSKTYVLGSFDWFFPDCVEGFNCTSWELNGNLAVPLTATGLDPYAGAGLSVGHRSIARTDDGPSASDTSLGLNLLAGLRFDLGVLDTFGQGRLVIGGDTQFIVTFGVLFGGDR